MDKKLALPAFGALVLAAAAFGVHVGQSAVSQINPLFFQGPAVHPRDRGAVVADALPRARPAFAELYGWEQGQAARNGDCIGCEALDARDAHAGGEVVFAVLETGWRTEPEPASYSRDPEPAPAQEAAPEPEPAGFVVEWADVDRYARYQVEEKPEAAEPAPEELAAFQE